MINVQRFLAVKLRSRLSVHSQGLLKDVKKYFQLLFGQDEEPSTSSFKPQLSSKSDTLDESEKGESRFNYKSFDQDS